MNRIFNYSAMMALAAVMVMQSDDAAALSLSKPIVNRTFQCEGGNESSGQFYYFRAGTKAIERLDYRFPDQSVLFKLGEANKGSLGNGWSFETLSNMDKSRVLLYERVSLRSTSQNKHVYRTYEIYNRGKKIFMVLYDGVNGARDWKIKTTRKCGLIEGNRIVQRGKRSYWSTSFMRGN